MKNIPQILLTLQILAQATAFAQPPWNGAADTAWYNASQREFAITTAEQLAGLAKLVNNGNSFNGKTVKLGANIMLNDTANWQNWASSPPLNKWTPIGKASSHRMLMFRHDPFTGIFDGNGFTVSGVYINASDNYQGFFGAVGSSGTIKNLGIAASYIKGNNFVGGFAGALVGSVVRNNYFAGMVTGDSAVGGFAGTNFSTISNCYSTGAVKGQKETGEFIGKNYGVIISNCHDIDSLNFMSSILSTNVWVHESGKYPKLSNQISKTASIGSFFERGTGTSAAPYIIATAKQFETFALLVNAGINLSGKHFKLGSNIMLNDTANWQNWASSPPAYKWVPIGTYVNAFTGTFDGGGHAVSGVYINNSNDRQGLFGYVVGGAIKNLGVYAFYIKGRDKIGGLVGEVVGEGAVSGSYSAGMVIGDAEVGGLAGQIRIGAAKNNYSAAAVTGKARVGGLIGYGDGAVISSSYAVGKVNGEKETGGLMGANRIACGRDILKELLNPYAPRALTAPSECKSIGGTITNSYYNKETSGQSDTGKGEGKTTSEMKQKATFKGWDFDHVWGISGKVNGGYPYLLNYNKSSP